MSFTQEDMTAVKALVKAGRIDEARALLTSIDDERARAALVRFNARYPAEDTDSGEIEPTPPRPNYLTRIVLAAGFTLVILALCFPLIQRYTNRVAIRLEALCRIEFLSGADTSDAVWAGCETEVRDKLIRYADEIRYCWDTHAQTDQSLAACLNDEGVYFSPLDESPLPR